MFSFSQWKMKKKMYSKNKNLFSVKPVFNNQPWDLEKVAVWKRCLKKVRLILAVNDKNWPLLTGGRCSVVVLKEGLTVMVCWIVSNLSFNSLCELLANLLLLKLTFWFENQVSLPTWHWYSFLITFSILKIFLF